jgi:hypothetical protein
MIHIIACMYNMDAGPYTLFSVDLAGLDFSSSFLTPTMNICCIAIQTNTSFIFVVQQSMSDSTTISFTTSNRGKPLLIHSGYLFRLKKSTIKVKYWACNSTGCAAGVHTNTNNDFLKSVGNHGHIPTPEQIELRDLKKKVKDRVQLETASIPKIYQEELARANLSALALTLAPSVNEASNCFVF